MIAKPLTAADGRTLASKRRWQRIKVEALAAGYPPLTPERRAVIDWAVARGEPFAITDLARDTGLTYSGAKDAVETLRAAKCLIVVRAVRGCLPGLYAVAPVVVQRLNLVTV